MQLNLDKYASVPDFFYGITREIWEDGAPISVMAKSHFNLTCNKVTAAYLVTDKVSIWKQILVNDARRRSAQSLQLRDQPS